MTSRLGSLSDGGAGAGQVSTVVDMTDAERPTVLRVGAGDPEPVLAMT
jgi:tRNA A37 threonylcarbamoyladenosine synthetase subunit TsaC/SUA5/YrdC